MEELLFGTAGIPLNSKDSTTAEGTALSESPNIEGNALLVKMIYNNLR